MKYMGSKRRLAKHIAPIIQGFIESSQAKTYIEPFVGGANMMEHIECEYRIGTDSHPYLIALLKAVQGGWCPPKFVTETQYHLIKNHPDGYPDELVGFVGFGCSYSGKWWGGYARNIRKDAPNAEVLNRTTRNYCDESRRNILKQFNAIQGVNFHCQSYLETFRHKNAVIYCDPPYQGATAYKTKFSHPEFWNWCRLQAVDNTVLVSEYVAPSFCTDLIWQKEITSSLRKDTGGKKGVEKLFWVKN